MSDSSGDFFDELGDLGNFELSLGGLLERMDQADHLLHNTTLQESKLFVSVSTAEGFPNKRGFLKNASVSYALQVEMGLDKHKRKLFAGTTPHVQSVKDESMFVFDVVDFYALSQMRFTLKRKNLMTGSKKVVGETSMRLMDFLSQQAKADESLSQLGLEEFVKKVGYVNSHVLIDTCMPIDLGEKYSWLETAKSAAMSQSAAATASIRSLEESHTVRSSGGGRHSVMRGYQEAEVVQPMARVRVNFKFRLLSLQRCLQPSSHLKSSAGSLAAAHSISDLHSFVTFARTNEVVEAMKGLATRQSLPQALRRHSSEGLMPLDFALLAGNAEVVTVILQRAGNLCFRGMAAAKRGPFHYAVLGGSKACMDLLVRFFTKYSSRELPLRNGVSHWSPLMSELVDWRDEHSETPLLLACRLNRPVMVSTLLLCGADIAAFNRTTSFTPLMCAAEVGATEIAAVLLSIIKSESELEEQLHDSGLSTGSVGYDSALAKHLRTNARSRTLLRVANPSSGGFFNKLCMHSCDPAHCEDGDGRQAVHLAALHGHVDVIRLLLTIGVSCAVTDRHGDTLFHLLGAVESRVVDVTQLLGWEARQWAMQRSQTSDVVVQTLQRRRRALLACNYRGRSPVEVAAECGQWEVGRKVLRSLLTVYPELGVASSSVKSLAAVALQSVDRLCALSLELSECEAAAANPEVDMPARAATAPASAARPVSSVTIITNRANSLELLPPPPPPRPDSLSLGSEQHRLRGAYEAVQGVAEDEKENDPPSPPSRPMSGNYSVPLSITERAEAVVAASALSDVGDRCERLSELRRRVAEHRKELTVVMRRIDAEVVRVDAVSRGESAEEEEDSMDDLEADDAADSVAYEFALSALAKKSLGGGGDGAQ